MTHGDTKRREIMAGSAPRGSQKGPRITVSLSERDHAALTELAERHDVSISWLTRQALVEFIKQYKDVQIRLPLYVKK